jgi:hypothetical protein
MIILGIPAIVMLIGLVMYYISEKPKNQDIGKVMFTCGLLVTLYFSSTLVK